MPVIKSLSIKNKQGVKGLLNYLLKSPDRIKNREGASMLVLQNLRGREIKDWAREFLENEENRLYKMEGNNILLHEILAYHPEDAKHMNEKVMEDLAYSYIQERAPDAMAIAVAHLDKGHPHIHVGISGVEYATGKSTRISKAEFAKVKSRFQELQKLRYPQLEKSLVRHGSGKKKA